MSAVVSTSVPVPPESAPRSASGGLQLADWAHTLESELEVIELVTSEPDEMSPQVLAGAIANLQRIAVDVRRADRAEAKGKEELLIVDRELVCHWVDELGEALDMLERGIYHPKYGSTSLDSTEGAAWLRGVRAKMGLECSKLRLGVCVSKQSVVSKQSADSPSAGPAAKGGAA